MTKRRMYLALASIVLPILILLGIYRQSHTLYVIGTIELGLIAVIINVFVGVYSQRNWDANAYGRALMYTMVSLAAVSYLSVITAFLGPQWEWRYFTRAVLFSAILIAHARMLHLLLSIRKQQPESEEKHE